jgi:hypothetical protein
MKQVEMSCFKLGSHCDSAENRGTSKNTVEIINIPEMKPPIPAVNNRPISTSLLKFFMV